MELLYAGPLADDPLDAATDFHARVLPGVEATLNAGADPLTLVFLPASHEHRGWRLAVVQGLARRFAPSRINAIECASQAEADAAVRWLDGAAGVTGQFLPLDGNGAGPVLYPAG
ncbi:Rossmann fold domain-containing protein [Novosphingobium beihaiensis]|uniref:Short chain dehydrogenase-like proteobacteria domain-containing protein n=1 Tax=Novosphingobium beihaiensis TaxID=2930389 RepID=A0ABT0BSU5_9SPHN|nr:hypothetical protein [Novosphingobium beihaiensis]MCJ2187739.1 hypothetical protein [Novosphingobium beihaiensis]